MTTTPEPQDDWPEGVVVPDDLSSLFGDSPAPTLPGAAAAPGEEPVAEEPVAEEDPAPPPVRTTAVVLTAVKQAKVLAGLMALQGIEAVTVPSKHGAIAVRYIVQDAAEVDPGEALSGLPREAEGLAAALSMLTRSDTALLAARVNDVDGEITGQVVARAYRGGRPSGDPPPGLVLARADQVAERLLIGLVKAEEVSGSVMPLGPGTAAAAVADAASAAAGTSEGRGKRSLFGRRRKPDAGGEQAPPAPAPDGEDAS